MFNGEIASTGAITKEVIGDLLINGHQEKLSFLVTKLNKDPIILGIPWLRKHEVTITWNTRNIEFKSNYCQKNCVPKPTGQKGDITRPTGQNKSPDISIIGAAAYLSLAKKPINTLFAASLEDINKALQPKKEIDPLTILPKEYHEFRDVFSKKKADILPEHRTYDHKIQLKEASSLPFSRLYPMSRDEL